MKDYLNDKEILRVTAKLFKIRETSKSKEQKALNWIYNSRDLKKINWMSKRHFWRIKITC